MISFLGSLPLGTLNVAAMQIGIYEGVKNAMYFSFGSLLVEMLYVRISLIGINWLQKQKRLLKIMQWVTFGIIVLLAFGSFYAAIKTSGGGQKMTGNHCGIFSIPNKCCQSKMCTGALGNHSSPRNAWVIFIKKSSTTTAKW